MRRCAELRHLRRPLLAGCAALLLAGCAAPQRVPSATLEQAAGDGFTISESPRAGSSARADFESALRLLRAERTREGIELLRKVTQAAPGATTAHIDLGIAYARIGELDAAEASLARALEINPRHPVAHNELGMLYRRTGRFPEARASYERALALHPAFHFAHRNLAILCDLYLADPACALDHYEAYLRSVPGDETAAMWVRDLRSRADR